MDMSFTAKIWGRFCKNYQVSLVLVEIGFPLFFFFFAFEDNLKKKNQYPCIFRSI